MDLIHNNYDCDYLIHLISLVLSSLENAEDIQDNSDKLLIYQRPLKIIIPNEILFQLYKIYINIPKPKYIEPTQFEIQKRSSHNCIICLEKRTMIAFIPCRHTICCKRCYRKMRKALIKSIWDLLLENKIMCPICRSPIKSILEINNISNPTKRFYFAD